VKNSALFYAYWYTGGVLYTYRQGNSLLRLRHKSDS